MKQTEIAVTAQGISAAAATERLAVYGENAIASSQHWQPLKAFLAKFNSPLLWIIVAAAIISFVTGSRINSIILVFMVMLSVLLDFANTYRSEKAVARLVARVVTTVHVIRDGQTTAIPIKNVVPGDMVVLSAGDVIPADGCVIEEKDLYVNESSMTGESVPVPKQIGNPAALRLTLGQPEAVFLGTSVVSGRGRMIVLRTGRQTEYGQIASRLENSAAPTDFERSIREFSVFLMWVTLAMTVVVFGLNLLHHDRSWLDSAIFAVAIAIGLTPELLPVIITVSLSRGAVALSKQEVIVKRLPAIQNLGRMDVLCTDKTGTLTENTITVVRFIDPAGQVNEDVLRIAYLNSIFHTGVANPLDAAIRDFRQWDVDHIQKIDEVPFDFERRRESVVVDEKNARLIITKGSPESMFAICQSAMIHGSLVAMNDAFLELARTQYRQLSADGYKVLAVAQRSVDQTDHAYEPADERAMTLVGFIALLDPPKKSAKQTIDDLAALGIETKILTGDGPLLTERICREIDLVSKGTMTGDALRSLTPGQWLAAVDGHTIFARIDPEQKEQIIRALQQGKHVVGFMGDGINDAPALKAADVGISVDNAVDVARETADIILLRTSLDVLRDGVIQGRRTFQNSLKYILMGLSSNFGNMFSMMVAAAFLPFLPMLPVQIILNNFLYDSSQLMLSTDSVDDDDIRRPTVWDIKFIRRFMMTFGPISSLFDFATFGLLWLAFHYTNAPFQTGWFIESVATQVFVIYVIRTKKLPFIRSRPSGWLLWNTVAAVAIAWAIPFLPAAQRLLGFQPLPWPILGMILGLVIVYLFLVEGVKRLFYRRLQPTLPTLPPVTPLLAQK